MKTNFIFNVFVSLMMLGFYSHSSQAEEYRVHWQVRANKILHNTVCQDYPKGSRQYRGCRGEAKRYFVDQCNALTSASRSVGKKETKAKRLEREKFCKAARTFNPVR